MEPRFKVAVRCRPLLNFETERGHANVVEISGNALQLKPDGVNGSAGKEFIFDYCYGGDSLHTTVNEDLGQPMVVNALAGVNGTILVYGQTGGGKTHSILGTSSSPGLVSQLSNDIFDLWEDKKEALEPNAAATMVISVSYFGMYNDAVTDILNQAHKDQSNLQPSTIGGKIELTELVSSVFGAIMLHPLPPREWCNKSMHTI